MLSAAGFKKRLVAGDRSSGALQGSLKDDVGCCACARRRAAEKTRNHDRRSGVECSEGMSPPDVATIVPAQHAVDCDVVQTAAEELDLLQKILYKVGEQGPKIVPLAANRSGASGIEQ